MSHLFRADVGLEPVSTLSKTWVCAVACMAMIMVGCASPPRPTLTHRASWDASSISPYEQDGLEVLLTARVGIHESWASRQSPHGEVFLAGDEEAYADLWEALRTSAERPFVNFGERVVLAEVQGDDGCLDEVRMLSRGGDGLMRLTTRGMVGACIIPLVTVAHVFSVPRAWLGSEPLLYQPANRKSPVTLDVGAPPDKPSVAPGPFRVVLKSKNTGVAGRIPKPAPGAVAVGELDNGERVFVVNHLDGTFTALPVSVDFGAYEGLKVALAWDPRIRRFVSWSGRSLQQAWDERGRSVFGTARAHLEAREARDGGSEVLVLHPRKFHDAPVAARPTNVLGTPQPLLQAFAKDKVLRLEEALAASGPRTLVFEASLVQYSDTPPALCEPDPAGNRTITRCPRGSPLLKGLGLPADKDTAYTFSGPFAARVSQGNILELVYLGGGMSSTTLRRASSPSERVRFAWTYGTALGAMANEEGAFYTGGALDTGPVWRLPPSSGFLGGLRSVAFGDLLGLDLRGRALPGISADGDLSTLATLSALPRLQIRLGEYWQLPSLLGAVLPEVGWLQDTDGPDGFFLAWSLHVEGGWFGVAVGGGPVLLWRDPFEGSLSDQIFGFSLGVRYF